MHNATPVLLFKTRRPTHRHYFLRVNFRPFSFFTRAKINPAYNSVSTLWSMKIRGNLLLSITLPNFNWYE